MWKPILILALCAACGPSSSPLDFKAVLDGKRVWSGPKPELIVCDDDGGKVAFEVWNNTDHEFFYMTYGTDEPWPWRQGRRQGEWKTDMLFCGTGLGYEPLGPGEMVGGNVYFCDGEDALRFTVNISTTPHMWGATPEDACIPFYLDSGEILRKAE
tara:strand:- start:5587 stop:6054 length:468 start_codon:yes stop_codon:yes gene_type:complete